MYIRTCVYVCTYIIDLIFPVILSTFDIHEHIVSVWPLSMALSNNVVLLGYTRIRTYVQCVLVHVRMYIMYICVSVHMYVHMHDYLWYVATFVWIVTFVCLFLYYQLNHRPTYGSMI